MRADPSLDAILVLIVIYARSVGTERVTTGTA
jgi:hypothetical protein